MSRRSSRALNSSTIGKDAASSNYVGVGEGKMMEVAGALLSEDVRLIDKIYANLRLRSFTG